MMIREYYNRDSGRDIGRDKIHLSCHSLSLLVTPFHSPRIKKKNMTINNSINQLKFNVMMKKVLMSFVALAAMAAGATGHG